MTNDSDATPRRKTLSVKRPRPAEKATAPATRETSAPRETAPPEQRGGRLFALDDHMRRMQADMDQLGSKKESQ